MPSDLRPSRTHRYRRKIARQIALFLLPTLAVLALLGRLDALTRLPPEFAKLGAMFGDTGDSGFYLAAAGGGMLAGAGLLALLDRSATLPRLGRVDALLPRTRAELAGAAALSVAAGIAEELFFRLLVPLLIAVATGGAVLGFAVATAVFAAAHRYQGGVGMLATLGIGALLACLYLATGDLAAAVALHIALDLITLVLRPALAGAWRRG